MYVKGGIVDITMIDLMYALFSMLFCGDELLLNGFVRQFFGCQSHFFYLLIVLLVDRNLALRSWFKYLYKESAYKDVIFGQSLLSLLEHQILFYWVQVEA